MYSCFKQLRIEVKLMVCIVLSLIRLVSLMCLIFKTTLTIWLWENPPLAHKDKYLEVHNSIIQSVISQEGSKLHAYISLQIYSYLIAIKLPTAQSTAS